MLAFDKDVWDGALSGHGLECVLNIGSVSDLIKFNNLCVDSFRLEKILGLLCEWAVALRVDHVVVAIDIGLDLSLE